MHRLIGEYEVCDNFEDKLIWKGSSTGAYLVKQFCKDHMIEGSDDEFNWKNIRIGFAPPKVENEIGIFRASVYLLQAGLENLVILDRVVGFILGSTKRLLKTISCLVRGTLYDSL
ncbi:hypothetical protein DITRI_Ditri13aG0050400 [Diplodiscus trichospermus]